MRKAKLILSLLLTIISSSIMGNNSIYDSKWNEVDKLMDKPLLKDAHKKVEEIRGIAKEKKDDLNTLRCEIYDYAIDFGCEYNITSENNTNPRNNNREEGEDIIIRHYKKASEQLDALKSPAEKACCELFMAKIVNDFIKTMKRYPGAVPGITQQESKTINAEDLREMSYENLRGVIRAHVDNIIEKKDILLSISSQQYHPLFVKKNDIADGFEETCPSLFDVMLPSLISFCYYDMIDMPLARSFYLPIHLVEKDILKKDHLNSIFADVINHHNNKKEYSAALSTELSRLRYLERSQDLDNELKINTLNDLIKQYEGKTSVVVNAIVKKQEIMCNSLQFNIDANAKNIESYPQMIIDEVKAYKELYPKHTDIKQLKKNIEWLNRAEISGAVERAAFGKGKDVNLAIKYANIDVLHADIYRSNLTPMELEKHDINDLKKATLVAKKDFKLNPTNFVIPKDTVINIGNDFEYGNYIVVFNNFDIHNRINFSITNLSILNVVSVGGTRDVFIVDGETGCPVENASVVRYNSSDKKTTQKTDVNGKTIIDLPDDKYNLYVHKENDAYARLYRIYRQYNETHWAGYQITILTDRNTYRPGQTIKGKVVLTCMSEKGESVYDNRKLKLVLKDANYNNIDNVEVQTNEFGSDEFAFTIPTDILNGRFCIEATFFDGNKRHYGQQYINVESYKLPVAEATIDIKDGSSTMFGNKLEFEGQIKTFSGEAVEGAIVKYRIESVVNINKTVLFSGETKCGGDGKFAFESDSSIIKKSDNYLNSSVIATIEAVLPSGETVSANKSVELAESPVSGHISYFNSLHEKHDSFKITVNLTNNAKAHNDAEAILTVSTKENKEKSIESKNLITKNIKGKGDISIEDLDFSSLNPAIYNVTLTTVSGEKLDLAEIILYDKTSAKMPEGYESALFVPQDKIEYQSGKDIDILIGSTEKASKILAVIRDENGKLLLDEWIDINNELKAYKVDCKKLFADETIDNLLVEFNIVKQHSVTTERVTIKRERVKENQEIEFQEIVRSIVPGEKQKVKIRVKPTDKSHEIAAVMVDKSLPGMTPNWRKLSHYPKSINRLNTRFPYTYSQPIYFREESEKGSYHEIPGVMFIWENITPMPQMTRWSLAMRAGANRVKAAPMLMSAKVEEDMDYAFEGKSDCTGAVSSISSDSYYDTTEETTEPVSFDDVKIRENFVETAFFYPQLKTQKDGIVEFEYTVPDALTAWKMLIFAHDKKLNSSIITEDLQTKMPFAVKASLPRFVRKRDKCSFATTITNNDENKKSGDVGIIIKDVATDKVISEQSRKFKVDGNKSKVEEWSFDVPAGVAAIEVKMVGKSGTFSDGEVHQLPVLPDGTHVVKSKSMHVRGGETKDFSIAYNEKEMQDAELTVEYTDNAAWQALMALPSIQDAKYDCATEYISTIYVNQMAQRIALLYPEIKNVIEEWKKEGNHAASPLEQNQELKNVLMQQTPWMCEAKNESEQRAMIIELYDEGRINSANKEAISKLQSLQKTDGGFAWFDGYESSEYVTTSVARRMVEMREYGVLPKECEKMLKDAVKYLDKALGKAYTDEIERKWNANREWVFDIFKIRISYDKHIDNSTQKMLDYYVDKARKEIKDMTLYGKASFAIMLKMKGDEKEAKQIVESLRQSATDNEELGMYWKENKDRWGRYGNAISTHAMLTKAFKETGCDDKELSDLRFHLITKKETTQWSNRENTLAAIDALVGDGKTTSDLRKEGNRNVAIIKIGGKQVDAKRASGDGYVKIHYNKDSFTPELCNNIHIEQPKNQEGIGGIYISYDAPYSEITSGKSGIEVKKKMYKVVIANDGDDNKEMLQEIKDGEKLKKGDKVKIVMTLRSDRDIDFVQLLDLRAACLEPVRKRPGIEWADGKCYYQSITDSEYSMFFDRISKGTRVFEYTLHVTQSGEYTQGITKVIPHYCPAFSANSEGGKVVVE